MTMTDPVADMLTRVRNASIAYHEQATMPSSKIKANIARILEQEGYILRMVRGRRHPAAQPHGAAQVRPPP